MDTPGTPATPSKQQHDENLVTKLFTEIGLLRFDNAAELLKKKSKKVPFRTSAEDEIKSRLSLMVEAESIYYSTAFNTQGKHNINSLYVQLLGELSALNDFEDSADPSQRLFDTSLFSDLHTFINVRLNLVGFYQSLTDITDPHDYSKHAEFVAGMQTGTSLIFKHPNVRLLKQNLQFELCSLHSLFSSQAAISNHRFPETSFHLCRVKRLLSQWGMALAKNLAYYTAPSQPALAHQPSPYLTSTNLFKWLSVLCQFSVSKSYLYFYPLLRELERDNSNNNSGIGSGMSGVGAEIASGVSEDEDRAAELFFESSSSSSSKKGSGSGGGGGGASAPKVGVDYVSWIESLLNFSQPEHVFLVMDASSGPCEIAGYSCPLVPPTPPPVPLGLPPLAPPSEPSTPTKKEISTPRIEPAPAIFGGSRASALTTALNETAAVPAATASTTRVESFADLSHASEVLGLETRMDKELGEYLVSKSPFGSFSARGSYMEQHLGKQKPPGLKVEPMTNDTLTSPEKPPKGKQQPTMATTGGARRRLIEAASPQPGTTPVVSFMHSAQLPLSPTRGGPSGIGSGIGDQDPMMFSDHSSGVGDIPPLSPSKSGQQQQQPSTPIRRKLFSSNKNSPSKKGNSDSATATPVSSEPPSRSQSPVQPPQIALPTISKFGFGSARLRGEQFSGLASWPCVFHYPTDKPPSLAHWPNVISIIEDQADHLTLSTQVAWFYEQRIDTTYFISRTDDKMYLVLIYKGKKKSGDRLITEFLTQMCVYLRNQNIFACLH